MSLVAPVKNGEIQEIKTTSSEEKSSSSLDKNAFLQLLVAQMKYQDPLEPTSNTEYISQLATFSSLEEMQNMTSSLELQRASSMVGQEVYIKTTDSTTGSSDYVHGKVDYVVYENGKAYLSVNGNNYPLDDLDSVYDSDYTEAYSTAYDWTVALNKLPALSKLTLSEEEAVAELKKTYDGMTDYQKTFLTTENVEKLENYVNQIELLKKVKEELENSGSDDTDETDKTDEISGADETDKTDEADKTDETGKENEIADTGKTDQTNESSQTEDHDEAKEVATAEGE